MPRASKQPTPPTPTATQDSDAAVLPSDTRTKQRRPMGDHPPFILAWQDDAIEVSSGMVVPVLMRYIVRNGVNGAGAITDRSGREIGVDPSLLRANLASWGKNEIPHAVDGRGTSYMRQPYPGVYVDRWTTVYEGTDRVTFDQRDYDEWRQSLITRGLVPAPRRPAIEALIARVENAHDNMVKRFGQLPAGVAAIGGAAELEGLREQIAILRRYLDEMLDQRPGVAVNATGTEATL